MSVLKDNFINMCWEYLITTSYYPLHACSSLFFPKMATHCMSYPIYSPCSATDIDMREQSMFSLWIWLEACDCLANGAASEVMLYDFQDQSSKDPSTPVTLPCLSLEPITMFWWSSSYTEKHHVGTLDNSTSKTLSQQVSINHYVCEWMSFRWSSLQHLNLLTEEQRQTIGPATIPDSQNPGDTKCDHCCFKLLNMRKFIMHEYIIWYIKLFLRIFYFCRNI